MGSYEILNMENGEIQVNSCPKFWGKADEFFMNISMYLTPPFLLSPCFKLFKKSIIKSYNILFPERMNYGEDAEFVLSYCEHIKTVYAMSRSRKKVMEKFGDKVTPVIQDVAQPLDILSKYDYIIHCASNADPKSYAIQPVETILTNILGNKNVLDYCKEYKKCRMLLTSTFEVYGEISNTSVYKENMSGIIDQTVLRNAYPESKRSCELLLRSYVDEYNINAVICRLPSVYGPTMLKSDSKAHGQFIKNALNKENIVLKSRGEQRRTYSYVVDVVSGIFKVLFNGLNGEIYNVANENSIASIAEVASICAEIAGTKVVFDLPDKIEKKGFSQSKDCILDNSKLKSLGWNGKYTLKQGLVETIESLREDK